MEKENRLIIGMSGASGAPLTTELLRQLRERHPETETHLIVTKAGEMTLRAETSLTYDDLREMCDVCHDAGSLGDSVASGSFRTLGMVVIPCSMKTVAGIVSGYSDNLLLRAADVTLKERRTLVLVARETPLSTLHLKNLYEASRYGAVILPPVPAYYNHPATVEDFTKATVERVLGQFYPGHESYEWPGIEDS